MPRKHPGCHCIALLLLFSCTSGESNPDRRKPKVQFVVHEYHSVGLELPVQWRVEQAQNTLSASGPEGHPAFHAVIALQPLDNAPTSAKESLENAHSSLKDLQWGHRGEESIGEHVYFAYDMSFSHLDEVFWRRGVLLDLEGGVRLALTYTAPQVLFPQLEPVFDHALASLSLPR